MVVGVLGMLEQEHPRHQNRMAVACYKTPTMYWQCGTDGAELLVRVVMMRATSCLSR